MNRASYRALLRDIGHVEATLADHWEVIRLELLAERRKSFEEQVRLSNQVIDEVIAEERAEIESLSALNDTSYAAPVA